MILYRPGSSPLAGRDRGPAARGRRGLRRALSRPRPEQFRARGPARRRPAPSTPGSRRRCSRYPLRPKRRQPARSSSEWSTWPGPGQTEKAARYFADDLLSTSQYGDATLRASVPPAEIPEMIDSIYAKLEVVRWRAESTGGATVIEVADVRTTQARLPDLDSAAAIYKVLVVGGRIARVSATFEPGSGREASGGLARAPGAGAPTNRRDCTRGHRARASDHRGPPNAGLAPCRDRSRSSPSPHSSLQSRSGSPSTWSVQRTPSRTSLPTSCPGR